MILLYGLGAIILREDDAPASISSIHLAQSGSNNHAAQAGQQAQAFCAAHIQTTTQQSQA